MSNDPSSGRRDTYLPRSDFNSLSIPMSRQPKRHWFRVHRSELPAIDFGIRPYHRFSHPESLFPLLYVGASLSTCLWEYFGDDIFRRRQVISKVKWDGCSLSRIEVPQLRVCSMGDGRTREVMRVDVSAVYDADLQMPQSWSLAIQRHPSGFEAIQYLSRFSDEPCLAVFDRSGIHDRLKEIPMGSLNELDEAVQWLTERGAALV
jgi:hypothetical protein